MYGAVWQQQHSEPASWGQWYVRLSSRRCCLRTLLLTPCRFYSCLKLMARGPTA